MITDYVIFNSKKITQCHSVYTKDLNYKQTNKQTNKKLC
jgi:hypothetical protein